ncbi:hypothetical protein QBC37DRAFT_399015 [Rhypophila decipiens]|uniref:Uncharacterized protein n=1 Tax=Rhypophila decipiens TaxID=261697 RepID=A0AAN6YAP3_9PEZI|nr:hypothetical protein QBC37DRAFT_399015 [Rhypophila decipiens]
MAPVLDPSIEKLGFLLNITIDQIHGEYVVKINDVTQKKIPVAIFPAPPKDPFDEWWVVLFLGVLGAMILPLFIVAAVESARKRRRIANTISATAAEDDAEAAGSDSDSCESNNKSMGEQGDKGHDGSPDLHTQEQLKGP